MSERDTHFQGFAEYQWEKMCQDSVLSRTLEDLSDRAGPGVDLDIPAFEQRMKTLLAQSDYDLAAYIVQETGLDQYDPATGYASATVEEAVNRISDFPHKPDS